MLGRATLNAAISTRACQSDRGNQPRGLHRQQPDHLQLDPGLGDPVPDVGVLGDRLTERGAPQRALVEQIERAPHSYTGSAG